MSQPVTVILRGGRVVDPGNGTDRVADVSITHGRVAAVGQGLPLDGSEHVIDVSDRIVGPGFVDLHSHVHSIAGQRLQAMDGVTTALDLEAGLMPVERAYADAAAAGRPLHYGFSASWGSARAQVLLGREADARFASGMQVLGEQGWQRSSSRSELTAWLGLLERELAQGALGIGVLVGYAPQTDPAEYLAVAALAASAGAPTFTHVRELAERDGTTPIDGPTEVTRAAAATGAAMHHCHVNSTSGLHVERVLRTLEESRAAGSRVTVEFYPYGSGSTGVGAAFLAPERLVHWGMEPSRIVMLGTGERVADAPRLLELRRIDPGAPCIVEFLDESSPAHQALLRRSMAFPDAMVASDALPIHWPDGADESTAWPLPPGGSTHPRTAGTFSRSLREMVRETGAWSWVEAFRRCAYLPARVLDEVAPVARGKGHLGVGADADIVVLDPSTITDQATYQDPTRAALGVTHLLVAGEFVVRDATLVTDAFPGRPVRGRPR